MAYRNYNPIKEITKSITVLAGKTPSKTHNEIDFIRQMITDSIEEGKELKGKLAEQLPLLKASFLFRLIKGRTDNLGNLEELFKLYNIEFLSDKFIVILLSINEAYTPEGDKIDHMHTIVRFAIMNAIEEIVNRKHMGMVVEVGDDTAGLILNLREDISDNQINEGIEILLDEIKEFMKTHYQTYFTVCVGGMHRGIKGINISYKEAQRALEYKMVKGNNATIHFNEITYSDKDYYYPLDIEKELINYVITGDGKKASTLLDKIFEENFIKRKLSSKLSQCMFFDIMSTAVKTLKEVNVDYKDVFGSDKDPMDELFKCQTVSEIHEAIKDIYSKLCMYVNQNKKSHNDKLKKRILSYLEANYRDECLNQAVMAEELGITSSYLSYLFKEQFGENMVDYVNRLKVSKAKELLQESTMSLLEIAQQVGCNNDKSLIRIFKKYEGVTPGKYRETLFQQ